MKADQPQSEVKVALREMFESGQRLVSHRIELFQLELKLKMKQQVASFSFLMGALLFLGGFWIVLMMAAVDLLQHRIPRWGALLGVSALHLLIALLCLMIAKAKGKPVTSQPKVEALSPMEQQQRKEQQHG